MGFNYQVSGCKSVSEFVEMMTESEGKQQELFVRFIKGNRWDGYLPFISKHGIDLTDMRLHLCGHPLAFFGPE